MPLQALDGLTSQQYEGMGAIAEEEFYEDGAVVVREGGALMLFVSVQVLRAHAHASTRHPGTTLVLANIVHGLARTRVP